MATKKCTEFRFIKKQLFVVKMEKIIFLLDNARQAINSIAAISYMPNSL